MKEIKCKSIVLTEEKETKVKISVSFFEGDNQQPEYTYKTGRYEICSVESIICITDELPVCLSSVIQDAVKGFMDRYSISHEDIENNYTAFMRIKIPYEGELYNMKLRSWMTDNYVKHLEECAKTYEGLVVPELLTEVIYTIKSCGADNKIKSASFMLIDLKNPEFHENFIDFDEAYFPTSYSAKVGDIVFNEADNVRYRVSKVPDYHGIYWDSGYRLIPIDGLYNRYRNLDNFKIERKGDE